MHLLLVKGFFSPRSHPQTQGHLPFNPAPQRVVVVFPLRSLHNRHSYDAPHHPHLGGSQILDPLLGKSCLKFYGTLDLLFGAHASDVQREGFVIGTKVIGSVGFFHPNIQTT